VRVLILDDDVDFLQLMKRRLKGARFYLISQIDQSELDALAREHGCDGAFNKNTPLDRIVAEISGG
jgi:hypothetical protein